MSNSTQVDTLCQLLIEKGIITEEEFYEKLKKFQEDYDQRNVAKT